MNIHEFGDSNKRHIVLLHPSVVKWDYFDDAVPLLEDDFHLIIPAIPGYDPDSDKDFTNVWQIAGELVDWLGQNGIDELYAVYGCSMGGSIALCMALGRKVKIRHCIMDGGITPYQLPRALTRLIAVRDYSMMMIGKAGGVKLLEKVFTSDEYTPDDLKYVSDVLRHSSSRTFESCNNYEVPDPAPYMDTKIHYWYGDGEQKVRSWDIGFMKKYLPDTEFTMLSGLGHAGLVLQRPQLFAELIRGLEPAGIQGDIPGGCLPEGSVARRYGHIQIGELSYAAQVRSWLNERYGREEGSKIWFRVVDRYNGWLPDLPDYGGKKNGHAMAIYGGLLVFALYEELPDQPPIDELQDFVQNMFVGSFTKLGKVFDLNRAGDMRLIDKVFLMVGIKDRRQAKKYPATFCNVSESYDPEHQAARYHFTQCPNAEFAKSHGLLHVLPLLCNSDFFGISEIHGQLIRTGTCGNSDICDYCIVGSRNPMAAEYETVTDEGGFLVSRKRVR